MRPHKTSANIELSAQLRARARTLVDDAQNLSLEFLTTDVDIGFSFVRSALLAGDHSVERDKGRHRARVAYDTVLRYSEQLGAKGMDTRKIEEGLARLRSDLYDLGESF